MEKFRTILAWAVIILLVSFGIYLILMPIINWTDQSELKICIRVFLIFQFIQTFGILRLYNSVMSNSRFIIKLREAVSKIMNRLPGTERVIQQNTSSNGSLKQTIDKLQDTIKSLESSLRKDE